MTSKPRVRRHPVSGLTNRQHQVLGLIVEGASNKLIALRLSIVESTVKETVGMLYRELGVQVRVEAAVLAVRRGWF